tara:strand:+ start:352 stop:531 length:180 start_codon:yes stop_codon:yes gene_type:complete
LKDELMKRFRVRYVPRLFMLDRTSRVAHQDTRQHLEEKSENSWPSSSEFTFSKKFGIKK